MVSRRNVFFFVCSVVPILDSRDNLRCCSSFRRPSFGGGIFCSGDVVRLLYTLLCTPPRERRNVWAETGLARADQFGLTLSLSSTHLKCERISNRTGWQYF